MKTAKKLYLLTFVLTSIMSMTLTSCSTDADKRAEAAKVVEARSTQDLLNDLYLASDNDTESLARMLQVTPSSIERLRNGKSDPTVQFDEKVKTVSIYYYQNNRKYSLLRSTLDPEYGWYDSVLNFPSHHPFVFWGGNIILLLALAFATLIAIWPILAEMLIFLIAWLASLIFSPTAMEDKYVDTINPVVEQVL